jgi:hypothetical protein
MLTAKWRTEMEERFGFELTDLKREQLDEMLERIEQDRLPSRFHGVCSLERRARFPLSHSIEFG